MSFLIQVHRHVRVQNTSLGKSLSAYFAGVRSFAGVLSHVNLE